MSLTTGSLRESWFEKNIRKNCFYWKIIKVEKSISFSFSKIKKKYQFQFLKENVKIENIFNWTRFDPICISKYSIDRFVQNYSSNKCKSLL